jgi:hypothetical protein
MHGRKDGQRRRHAWRAHTFFTEMRAFLKLLLCYPLAHMRVSLRLVGSVALASTLVLGLSLGSSRASQRRRPAPKTPAAKKKTPVVETPEPPPQEMHLEPLPADPAVENADLAITARVKASSLRFDVVPNPTVEFPGKPQRDTVWEAQRDNLPTPVEPGVTYRNIGIRLKITSVFSDIDRIVAEALGEIPIVEGKTVATEISGHPSVVKKLPSPTLQSAPPAVTPKERQ